VRLKSPHPQQVAGKLTLRTSGPRLIAGERIVDYASDWTTSGLAGEKVDRRNAIFAIGNRKVSKRSVIVPPLFSA
jgi:hypothetical protein